MATTYHITVRYDSSDGSLKIEPTKKKDLTLEPGTAAIHSLRWVFEGVDGLVEAGWAPSIRFFLGPKEKVPQYSGPFINLTRTTSSVIASGNAGKSGSFRYRAMLQPPSSSDLPEIRSSEARLFNQVMEATPSVIRVRRCQQNKQVLLVEPEAVTCTAGQAILWEVIDSPTDIGKWYPRIAFVDGPAGMNSHLGPFTSMDTRNESILASGSSGHTGQYKYLFQMVSVEDGRVRFESSPDPTIDDEGEPPAAEGEPPGGG